jgi:hypothetical protein
MTPRAELWRTTAAGSPRPLQAILPAAPPAKQFTTLFQPDVLKTFWMVFQ